MKRQVFFRMCVVCNRAIGCYDSAHDPQRRECKICTDICPIPTDQPTNGFCDFHFEGEMQRLRTKRGG